MSSIQPTKICPPHIAYFTHECRLVFIGMWQFLLSSLFARKCHILDTGYAFFFSCTHLQTLQTRMIRRHLEGVHIVTGCIFHHFLLSECITINTIKSISRLCFTKLLTSGSDESKYRYLLMEEFFIRTH